MGRAECLVVLCSVIIIAVFSVFCYLMSTVNPPRLATDAPPKAKPSPKNTTKEKFVNFYFRNNVDPTEDVDTEKANGTEITPSPSLVPFYPHRRANLLPSIQYKNPNLVKVYPPIWMPVPGIKPDVTRFKLSRNVSINQTTLTNDTTSKTTISNTTVDSRTTESEIKDNVKTSENTTKLPLIQRRSVKVDKRVDRDTGAVILRILDDYGKSRIEIKLHPSEEFGNKQMRKNRSFRKENNLNIAEGQSDDDKDTEIKILPNATVIINNQIHWIDNNRNIHKPVHNKTRDNFNTTDKSVTARETHFTGKQSNNKMETSKAYLARKQKYSRNSDLNSTSTESLVLKVLFDNETRSFTDLNHNVSNDLTIFELK